MYYIVFPIKMANGLYIFVYDNILSTHNFSKKHLTNRIKRSPFDVLIFFF